MKMLGECREGNVLPAEASTTAERAFTAVVQEKTRLLPSSPHYIT